MSFFFFKQKTAYEMRISDWSSDVCFSDLDPAVQPFVPADPAVRMVSGFVEKSNVSAAETMVALIENSRRFEMQMKVIRDAGSNAQQIGRASCRERVCQYV